MSPLSDPAVVVTLVVAGGVAAQWGAARLRLPAILPLLLLGFLAGPLTGLLDPDITFGPLLFPAISTAVAIILFEGALTLRLQDIRGAERVVLRLITLGAGATVAVLAAAAHLALALPWPLALLFGCIGAVSGPTVVVPLLRAVRPSERVAQVLRWEGILIDPLGAVLAVIVFEAILAGAGGDHSHAALTLLRILAAGIVCGSVAGYAFGVVLRRHLLPDYLRNFATLGVVLLANSGANLLAPEAGLVAVTAMGLVLGNLKGVPTDEILDFKESLSILLISALFIVLAARIDLGALTGLGPGLLILLAAVLLVARPLAVALSTVGSRLSWRERALLAWIAPRGIVAAAVSALFALRLQAEGLAEARLLVPLTFAVIVATVVLQSLTARPLARLLGVAEPEARGVLIVGGNPVALAIAKALYAHDIRVLVADPDWGQTRQARMAGLPTFFGNAVSEYADRRLDLLGLGKLLALSRRPALNALACLRYRPEFGSANVFTIRQEAGQTDREGETAAAAFRGHLLFKPELTLQRLQERLAAGETVRVTKLSEDFGFDALLQKTGGTGPMLFAIAPAGVVHPFSEEMGFRAGPGWRIAYLAPPEAEAEAEAGEKA